MKRLVSSFLLFVFVFALLGEFSVSRLIPEHPQQGWAKIAMLVISLVAGTLLARREPFKSFLSAKPVMLFLFLFNLAAGVLALVLIDGSKGISTGIGLIVVSLGAGSGLVLNRKEKKA